MEGILRRWDRQILLNSLELAAEDIHPYMRASGSALRSGAQPADVSAAERRVGQPLPSSYKAFLSHSDGAYGSLFAQLSGDDEPRYLFGAASVNLTRRSSFESAAQYIMEMGGENWPDRFGRTAADRLGYQRADHDEAAYLKNGTLGYKAKDWDFKLGQTMHTVTIGDWGGQGHLLLNPLVVDGRGEWEVIELHHFGMQRFPSFGDWLTDAVESMERSNPDNGEAIELPPLPEKLRPRAGVPDPTVWHTIRPLLLQGNVGEAAAAVANDDRVMHDVNLALLVAFKLATYDMPDVWRTLHIMATAPSSVRHFSLIAAGTTSAPYVTELASAALSETEAHGIPLGDYGRTALELHQLPATSDYLHTIATRGDLWALRALGRRRDNRALLPALELLGSTDPEEALTGAEVLRDLRHPDSVLALGETVRSSTDPNLTITAAHALVMTSPSAATGPLTATGALTPAGRHLTDLWRRQITPTQPNDTPPD